MPITSRYNQYSGINPHLNSYLQNTWGYWQSFHTMHIAKISEVLNRQLPDGYYALAEQSLQLREQLLPKSHAPRPDVTVYTTREIAAPSLATALPAPSRIDPLLEVLELDDEADYLPAAMIFDDETDLPVCRIELLSPTNKPHRAGYKEYWEKRVQTLREGTPLIELDYLHQSPPIIRKLPSYAHNDESAQAYMLIVSDPRPTLAESVSKSYFFGVDDPIPAVEIPLKGRDKVAFDFTVPYNETFEVNRHYHTVADYEQLPLAFNTYSPLDQVRIQARMTAIAQAVQHGTPLTQTPLPL